jgi:hypothetical protein
MNTRISLVSIMLIIGFLVSAHPESHAGLIVQAQANAPNLLPAFLEKGKTYTFTFVVSQGDYNITAPFPLSITGRIEKMDSQTGWLHINHLVWVKKGKAVESKYEGYSWINFNQVFQCTEMTKTP